MKKYDFQKQAVRFTGIKVGDQVTVDTRNGTTVLVKLTALIDEVQSYQGVVVYVEKQVWDLKIGDEIQFACECVSGMAF